MNKMKEKMSIRTKINLQKISHNTSVDHNFMKTQIFDDEKTINKINYLQL